MGLGGQAHTLEDELDMMEDDLDMMEDDPKCTLFQVSQVVIN